MNSKLIILVLYEREYENKLVKGKWCVYELVDESGEIDFIVFDENVKRLELIFNES